MTDFLSQDQIDNLLKEQALGTFDAPAEPVALDAAPDDEQIDYQLLQAAFDFFYQHASSVTSSVLNNETTFSVVKSLLYAHQSITESIPDPVLEIKISLSGSLDGFFTVLMNTKHVALISDLMMMGDGKAEYNDEHKDAIGELFNQVCGAFATALTERSGSSVSIASIAVNTFEPETVEKETDLVLGTIKVGDRESIQSAIIVSRNLSQKLSLIFKSNQTLDTSNFGSESIGLSAGELNDLNQLGSDLTTSGSSGSTNFLMSNTREHSGTTESIEMLLDIEMNVAIELGSTDLSIKRILELAPGSVIELDRLAGEPVDLIVNNKIVAKGEVVVVDENFGIRIVSLVSPEERIKSLR